MSKSFRELVEAINKKVKDDLAIGSKNRAKGHRKFVAAHPVEVVGLEDNEVTVVPDKLREDVSDTLVKIAKSGKAAQVTFADGDTAEVNPKSAKKLLDTQSKLNAANAKKFNGALNKSAADFLKMMNFSGPSKGDE